MQDTLENAMLMSFPVVPEPDRLDHAATLPRCAAFHRSMGMPWDQRRGAGGAMRCFRCRTLSALLDSFSLRLKHIRSF